MKTIDPIGRREKNLERIAARHGLTFYLDGRFLVNLSGWDTTREATDEEITMWSIISLENPDSLQASPDEIKGSWADRKGPFTINAKDYHGLKGCGSNYFVPENDKHNLFLGLIGHFDGKEVYVSKAIHVGFFYEGPRIPELHWHPNPANRYETEPEISAEVELRVWNTLYPFKLTP
jgi:hypothetical protein